MLSGHQLQVQDNEQWEGGREGGGGDHMGSYSLADLKLTISVGI